MFSFLEVRLQKNLRVHGSSVTCFLTYRVLISRTDRSRKFGDGLAYIADTK